MTDAIELTISVIFGALCVAIAASIYAKAYKKVASGGGLIPPPAYRSGDLIFALMLAAWFGTSAFSGFLMKESERVVDSGGIIDGGAMFIVIVGLIIAFTCKRKVARSFGFFTTGPVKVIGWSMLYLLAAYPLIVLGSLLAKILSRAEPTSQGIVEYFMTTEDPTNRLLVIVMAVLLAPIAEEIIFRGYLYGVFKKYLGFRTSMLATSALFALVHLHFPSLGILLVLAICLTLAYEATGSIWVPMIMHALFNSVSLGVMLLAPELVP